MISPVDIANALRGPLRRIFGAAMALWALAAGLSGSGQEIDRGESLRKDGLVLTVPNPIKGETTELLRKKILDAVQRQKRPIETVVFDFNPDELPAGSSSFGASLELAELIRKLQLGEATLPRVSTIAFVSKSVTKHTVLPVLACGQIVFGPDGSLGDVPREDLAKETVRTAYREQAKYHASPDLAMRVADSDLALQRVKTPKGDRIVSSKTLEGWRQKGTEADVVPGELRGLEPGRALIDAEAARDHGLASATFGSRGELIESLGMSRRSLAEDWLVDRTPVVWRIETRGALSSGALQSLERRINYAIGRNANFVILQFEGEAGDIRNVANLANELRMKKDNAGVSPVRFVAYVPPGKSIGAATFLALGCGEIVMGKDSALADFRYLSEADRKSAVDMIVPLAKAQGYPPLLFRASLEPNLTLTRVRSKVEASAPPQLVTTAEFQADQKSPQPRWTSLGTIPPNDGNLLKITPALAREWQIADATDVDTIEALYARLGLEADKVRVSRDDTLDRVAEFFREPWVNFLLITFGVVGLILELKLPGTTIPGTIAAICFVLFFWAYSFVGEFTLLAVFLFLLGLVMLGIEIFVVPGITFVGLTGIVLVLVSLGLVTLDRMPSTSQDWFNLGSTLTTFGFSLVAAVIGAICLTYYLPSIPYASRLVLKPPPDDTASADLSRIPPELLGAIGTAVTTLRPAGKVQFGDEFLDVVAEGDFVESGSRVQVIEIEGSRIVVKEV